MNARISARQWAQQNHGEHISEVVIKGNHENAIAECLKCEQGKVFGDPSDVFDAVGKESE